MSNTIVVVLRWLKASVGRVATYIRPLVFSTLAARTGFFDCMSRSVRSLTQVSWVNSIPHTTTKNTIAHIATNTAICPKSTFVRALVFFSWASRSWTMCLTYQGKLARCQFEGTETFDTSWHVTIINQLNVIRNRTNHTQKCMFIRAHTRRMSHTHTRTRANAHFTCE